MRDEVIRRLEPITAEEQRILEGGSLDLTEYNHLGVPVVEPGKLMPDGALFGIRPHTRFADFPLHSHEYVEMIYQLRGETVHRMENRTLLTLTEGKLLLLSRGTSHAIKTAGERDLAVNFILIPAFFDGAALALGSGSALSVFLKSNLQNRKLPGSHLLFDVSASPMIENILENLIFGELEGVDLEIQRTTLELLLRHLSGLSEKLILGTKADREQAMVLEVLARIERDVKLNLSDLAEEQNVDVSRLSRLIKKYTGCSFMELLHTARFGRAVNLLRDTELSVTDIATAVGYENTAFFYRRFGEKYSCTPAVYRKKLQN